VGVHHLEVGARVGCLAGEGGPQQAAGGVDVPALVGGVAEVPLGSHVGRAADQGPGAGDARPLRQLAFDRDAEVGQVGDQPVGPGPQQDVARLHVAVDHAGGVGVCQRLHDLGDQGEGVTAREWPVLLQPRLQVAVGEELGGEEDGVVVLAVVIDADDVA